MKLSSLGPYPVETAKPLHLGSIAKILCFKYLLGITWYQSVGHIKGLLFGFLKALLFASTWSLRPGADSLCRRDLAYQQKLKRLLTPGALQETWKLDEAGVVNPFVSYLTLHQTWLSEVLFGFCTRQGLSKQMSSLIQCNCVENQSDPHRVLANILLQFCLGTGQSGPIEFLALGESSLIIGQRPPCCRSDFCRWNWRLFPWPLLQWNSALIQYTLTHVIAPTLRLPLSLISLHEPAIPVTPCFCLSIRAVKNRWLLNQELHWG